MALNWLSEGMKVGWVILVFSTLFFTTTTTLAPVSLSKPGCQQKCGNVTIPYPFGVGSKCSANSSFTVICKGSTTPILSSINMEAIHILLWGLVVVKQPVSPMNCSGVQSPGRLPISFSGTPFTISPRYNSLFVFGCQNSVWLRANKTSTLGGCTPLCDADSRESNCNGVNCCETTIPQRLKEVQYTYKTNDGGSNNRSCGYVFPADKKRLGKDYGSYRSLLVLSDHPNTFAPLVLEWEYGQLKGYSNPTCTFSHDYCLSIPDEFGNRYRTNSRSCLFKHFDDYCSIYPNSYDCRSRSLDAQYYFTNYYNGYDYVSSTKYCSCPRGYEGNPYLPDGCRDIDECRTQPPNKCGSWTCINVKGDYYCRDTNRKRKARVKVALITVGTAIGTLVLLLVAWKSAKAIRKRIKANRRHEFFKRNGGLLLEQQLSATDNGLEKTKLYVNCCQIVISTRLQELQFNYESIHNHPGNSSFCGYVITTDKKWLQNEVYKRYKGLVNDLTNPFDPDFRFAPLVLEWELDTICNSHSVQISHIYNSSIDYTSSIRYCSCSPGYYEGNPYIVEGCGDIDECINKTLNDCRLDQICINTNGSFSCHNLQFRMPVLLAIVTNPKIIISFFGGLLFLGAAWKSGKAISKAIKVVKASRKYMFFKQNGGLLLEQQLAPVENGLEKTKLFNSSELAQATDNYNENRILGRGGEGIVYKGMLEDGTTVAVKKSERVNQGDVEAFINEVVIVSQINHRNVVKLLGCCLESEVPRLVYEFIPNGTLFQHIHVPNEDFPLFWEMRVRIAKEVAGALAYLHSAASVPIYHRDIKSTNILLDEKYRAKISDFGTSRSVSIDQTHVTTRVVGTFGYLDPEYFRSSQFTEKSDVYSFGVVLVELLTGEKAISAVRVEEGRGLAMHFLLSMKGNQLFEILDARVLSEGRREDIEAMAEIARKCLHLNGKSRPTMKEVSRDLDAIHVAKQDDSKFPIETSGCNSVEDSHSDFSSP